MSLKYVTHFSRDVSLGQIRILNHGAGGRGGRGVGEGVGWGEKGERDILNLRLKSMRALMSVDLHLCLSQGVSLFLDNIAEVNL